MCIILPITNSINSPNKQQNLTGNFCYGIIKTYHFCCKKLICAQNETDTKIKVVYKSGSKFAYIYTCEIINFTPGRQTK